MQPTEDGELASRSLRKELGLRDLVPMQILLVVGIFPAGIAARQGGTHVLLWLLSVALLLLPTAGLVQYCVKIWPYEGGVYQWAKHTIGPFAGFLCAWNLGAYFLLLTSNLGILTASSLSYGLGPRAAWMVDSRVFITGLNVGLFALIFLINIPGLGVGRWVAHLGTGIIPVSYTHLDVYKRQLYILLACWLFTRLYRYAVRSGLLARYSAESMS